MARLLIVGGGCRGRLLATEMGREGHAVRIVTRSDAGRAAIEAVDAECFIGDPNRLATLRGALDGVTVACWLLATATGSPARLRELHVSRLPAFLGTAIDSTMRGFVFEASARAREQDVCVQSSALTEGARIVLSVARRNAISARALTADPRDVGLWLGAARATLSVFL